MLFFLFPLGALTILSAHAYFYWHLFHGMRCRALRRAGLVLVSALCLLLLLGAAAYRWVPSPLTVALQRGSYLWMILGAYLLLALLAIDAVSIAVFAVRKRKKRTSESTSALSEETPTDAAGRAPVSDRRPPATSQRVADVDSARRRFLVSTGMLGLGLALPVSGWGVWRAFHPCRVTEAAVPIDRLPARASGLTIALLSDIHAGGWCDRDFVQSLVDCANELKPDLVAITGDLVDGSVSLLADIVAPLSQLEPRLGTFFVIGNHELYSGVVPWTRHLPRLGIRVLRNERVELDGIDLLGVDDWSAARRGLSPGYDLEAALRGRDPSRPAVLLAHQPSGFREAAARGVDLQLSGHTHGGQLWPFRIAAQYANQGYLAGLYEHGRSHLYVTRGCGFWGPPARVGAPPEIARITLVSR